MIAAVAANASAPKVAAISVGIVSGLTGTYKKLARGAVGAAAWGCSADDGVALLAGTAVAGPVLVGVAAAGKSGQRVATAAVAFQTEAVAGAAWFTTGFAGG